MNHVVVVRGIGWCIRRALVVVLMLLLITVPALPLHARLGGDVAASPGVTYEITWSTIDGGGAMFSTGRGYTLGGTVGQPDAGVLTGGEYTLAGGFWGGGAAVVAYDIYLPVVLR